MAERRIQTWSRERWAALGDNSEAKHAEARTAGERHRNARGTLDRLEREISDARSRLKRFEVVNPQLERAVEEVRSECGRLGELVESSRARANAAAQLVEHVRRWLADHGQDPDGGAQGRAVVHHEEADAIRERLEVSP